MQIEGARILILGGSGLVGTAIARALLPRRPAAVYVAGLVQSEAEEAAAELRQEAGDAEVVPLWGNVFVPWAQKDVPPRLLSRDPAAVRAIVEDTYGLAGVDAIHGPDAEAALRSVSTLGRFLLDHRPQIVVDCVNTATGIAYENVFRSARDLIAAEAGDTLSREVVEQHLATLYMPKLIRHVQLALAGMERAGTQMYLKVGTAGSGGMGLNIPFTHSEGRPSRELLAKSAVAGAHTLLLYLMARTPGAPAVKEIKPTAAISWKRIGVGEVRRGGRAIPLVDARGPVPVGDAFPTEGGEFGVDTGKPLRGVFLDSGENGFFSPPEFETLTALGLMEFITPEEIARDAVREIEGRPTGRDVVAALDASTSGPTYRAGILRQSALARMDALEREHGLEGVAYEMLGPPRLAKLLFEAALLRRLSGDRLTAAAEIDPAEASRAAAALLDGDPELRARMISIGIPVLLPDGESLLRGPDVKVAPDPCHGAAAAEKACENGWVDLRASNWDRWRRRAADMLAGTRGIADADHGSREDLEPWGDEPPVRPGAMAAWIFRYEDGGERTKR